jgi:very-short-patch-repair endonuclease
MRPPQQTHGWDTRIADLAETQQGVVSRDQLLELGLSADAIKRRLRAGRLHQIHRGVYAVGHTVLSRHAHWMAAVLFCGPGTVLSHWSAAALWGIRDHYGGPIHVSSPRKTKSRGPMHRHHALLPADEVGTEAGIPVTSVPRTTFDLAATSNDPHLVENLLRQSEYRRLYDPLSLWDLLERYPGQRGSRAARTALASLGKGSGEADGTLEECFLAFLDAHRLLRPNLNVWLEVGGHRYKVDCLWPAQRQIVELDSWQAHGTHSAFHADRSRNRRLEAAGYRVTNLTWHHLEHEASELAADLRALLGTR